MNIILNFLLILEILTGLVPDKGKHDNCFADLQPKSGLVLIISDIKTNKGLLRIGFYSSDAGFPDKPAISYSLSKDTITNGFLRLFIPITREGSYSISILDDENINGRMDYRLGVIPKEGFGFTNNPPIKLRPPSFSETSIKYSGGKQKVIVKMIYM